MPDDNRMEEVLISVPTSNLFLGQYTLKYRDFKLLLSLKG
jgi:hypothetical protein